VSDTPQINWGDTLFMAGVALVVVVAVLAIFPSLRDRVARPPTPEPQK
jgi:hypothetical protein